jgi:hypothetical protein
MTTGNAAIAYLNLADSATPTASSAGASTPVTNLQTIPVSSKWRGTGGTTDNFTFTWASDQTADTFMVAGLGSTFLATGTVRLQLFNSAAVQIYDSGTVAAVVDPSYGYAIHLLTAATYTTIRSAKWTFTQASASYIEAGRVFVGVRTQFTYNYAPGAGLGWNDDASKWTVLEGGGVAVDARPQHREWEFNFGWVTEAQYLSAVEPMDIANGRRVDILFIRDPVNSNFGLVSVWGLMQQLSKTMQPFTIGDLYSRAYAIRERRA